MIIFRVDASVRMGAGHVMRCLTLADAMQRQAEIIFICRDLSGNMQATIEQRGYQVVLLPKPESEYIPQEEDLAHAEWLGVHWLQDAIEISEQIKNCNSEWLVVDHYSLDYRWQEKLRPLVKKIFVIDDIADRKLDCDLLLDQTFGKMESDYDSLVPKGCVKLVGAQYALLRPEFGQLRTQALDIRNKFSEIKKILVTMGGSDPDNVTSTVLKGLELISWQKKPRVDVIMGGSSPHIDTIRDIANSHNLQVSVSTNVTNMAERMLAADLAIGAGGSTSWERCCLGLPTLTTLNAVNQTGIIKHLEDFGAIISLGFYKEITPQGLSEKLNFLHNNPKILERLSTKSFEVTDGHGVGRVLERMNVT